jgi:hypothetical protein
MFSTAEDFARYPMEKLSRLAAALPDGSPIKPNVLKAIAAKQGRAAANRVFSQVAG